MSKIAQLCVDPWTLRKTDHHIADTCLNAPVGPACTRSRLIYHSSPPPHHPPTPTYMGHRGTCKTMTSNYPSAPPSPSAPAPPRHRGRPPHTARQRPGRGDAGVGGLLSDRRQQGHMEEGRGEGTTQSLGLPLCRASHARHRAHGGGRGGHARAPLWVAGSEEAAGSPVRLLLHGITLELNCSGPTRQQSAGMFSFFFHDT